MRRSAIIRIVLWSIIALALTSVLTGFLGGYRSRHNSLFTGLFDFLDSDNHYEFQSDYINGGAHLPADSIRSIEVHWNSGSVQVQTYDGAEIYFEESGRHINGDQLCYLQRDGKLIIRYSRTERGWSWFSALPAKALTLYIPQNMQQLREIKIETLSADTSILDVHCEKIDVESASGRIELQRAAAQLLSLESISGKVNCTGCTAREAEVESTSGAIQLQGSFEEVTAENVSGSIGMELSDAPMRMRAESVSGSIRISMEEPQGFTAKVNTISGAFHCDYPVTSQGDRYIYGDGAWEYCFETISGSISIQN